MKYRMYGLIAGIAVLALVAAVMFLVILPQQREVSFSIPDRCGPIMNMVSHSVGDEYVCRNKCLSQCEVKELKLYRSEFTRNMGGCNNCTCFCR